MKRFFLIFIWLCCLGFLSGCGKSTSQTLVSISVAPNPVALRVGASQIFTATANYSSGLFATFTPTWSVEGNIGTITASGEFTAGNSAGTGKVKATSGNIFGEANVTVTTAEITRISVSPATATLNVGAAQTFTATAYDSQDNQIAFTPTWSVTGGIGTITAAGIFTATAAGTGLVRAASASVFGEADVTVNASSGHNLTNLFFLHHSTGANLINQGGVRNFINNYNSSHSTSFAFWDHGYNSDGLTNAAGEATGTNYSVPSDNTDPDGLHYLWTSSNDDAASCRNQIMAAHQVIAFKSCFPASAITSDDMLQQYKTWYLAMRNYFDTHPEKLFVVMSTPPLHRLATNASEASRARAFANWLKSSEFLSGHTNIVCFDLFNYLAGTDNFLKYEYEGSHSDSDSHPNETANQTVGPIFAQFLIDSALSY